MLLVDRHALSGNLLSVPIGIYEMGVCLHLRLQLCSSYLFSGKNKAFVLKCQRRGEKHWEQT